MDNLCKIREIQRSVNIFERSLEDNFGISLNEAMTLCSLSKNEKLSSGQVSDMLGLTPSNTSKVIASIERKGFIKRIIGECDKRQMYFTLTDKGTTLLGSISCDKMDITPLLASIL